MEGANANFWVSREFSNIFSPCFSAADLPSASASAEAVSNQIPKTTVANLISQHYGATRHAATEKADGERYGNHQTLNYASTEQESSQGQDRAKHNDPEINDKTLNYLPALSRGYECPNTAGSNSEANGDNHQTLPWLQKQPAGYDCPNIAHTSLGINADNHRNFNNMSTHLGIEKASYSSRKRKSPEDTVNRRSRKIMNDKAYRDRCKEEKENIKAENGLLKTEISRLNEESVGKDHSLRNQEEEIKKLQQNVRQLEDELHKKTLVMDVVSEKLDCNQNIHLRHEITFLKSRMDHILSASTYSPDSIHRQLQERNDQLHRENSRLRMIVEALCQKINNDKDPLQEKRPTVAPPSATKRP